MSVEDASTVGLYCWRLCCHQQKLNHTSSILLGREPGVLHPGRLRSQLLAFAGYDVELTAGSAPKFPPNKGCTLSSFCGVSYTEACMYDAYMYAGC